uniref:Uncharacterized protein n=1 Tax=viral metagenome TaxID=1070528 RepID=A0A6C0B4U6_9ZZZZ
MGVIRMPNEKSWNGSEIQNELFRSYAPPTKSP